MTSRERLQAAWDHTPLPIETAAGRIGRAGAARATAPAPGVDPSRRLDAHRLRARPSDCRTTRPGAGSLEEPSTLVTRGLHGRSRNPIYLGYNAVHLGLAAAIRNAWMLASFPVSAALLHRCVLREGFGDEYDALHGWLHPWVWGDARAVAAPDFADTPRTGTNIRRTIPMTIYGCITWQCVCEELSHRMPLLRVSCSFATICRSPSSSARAQVHRKGRRGVRLRKLRAHS